MKIDSSKNVPALFKLVRAFLTPTFARAGWLSLIFACAVHAQQVTHPDTIHSEEQSTADISDSPDQQNTEVANPSRPEPGSASHWLQRLSSATRQLNYQVAFVQSRAGQETIPYLWRHAVLEDGTSMEQLNLQNGPGRELIRVGEVVSVFEPDVPPYSLYSRVISGPIPSELLYDPESLQKGYKFIAIGRARVAGRPAQQIRIVSRDNSRFSYQLYLDEATGMLLKLNMLDLQGSLLEQIQVTSLQVSDKPHPYFSRVNQASLPGPVAITPNQPRRHNWEVSYMPEGMSEVKRDIRRLGLTGQVVEYKMFSDGLVDVSVYVQPASEAVGSDLVLRHEVNTFLTLTDGQAQVTVVGEIPLKTANAIATSLTVREKGL